MKYFVISLSLTQEGKPFYKNGKPHVRTEEVDTKTNELFKYCRSKQDVADTYTAFWKLDKYWKKGQCEVLKVIREWS